MCCRHAQVEELVAGTNTGKSPQLAGYYSYWEMAVFNALALMVLRALEKLHTILSSAKKPLFKVSQVHDELSAPASLMLCCHKQGRGQMPHVSVAKSKPTATVSVLIGRAAEQ
jgi:hypothetical protein